MQTGHNSGAARDLAVGLIGLGHQGSILAKAMLDRGIRLEVFDRQANAITGLVSRGATAAVSAHELAMAADIVMICVADDHQIEQLMIGPGQVLSAMRCGATLVIHSTISPASLSQLISAASQCSVEVVDAPVSGGAEPAAPLCYMVGGLAVAVQRCLPYFGAEREQIVLTGGPGTGLIAKLTHQLILCGTLLALEEGQRFATALGINLDRAASALRAGVTGSCLSDRLGGTIVKPGTERLLLKDLAICQSLVGESNPLFPGLSAAAGVLSKRAVRPTWQGRNSVDDSNR